MSVSDHTAFEPLLTEEEAKKVIRGPLPPGDYYLFGSDACVEGAIFAGCRYYAGYPITPASEIMEKAAERLPQVGGRFIQMEDEISSACSLIGASWAGTKAMTATSGPGFSLMMEAVSFAIMSETPFLIVNVQRPGPGQGYITSSQEDVMQARWGHHGGGPLIALAPSSVQEMFDFTIEAFNYAEKWRVPVILLADETVAHMRERLTVPTREKVKIVNRIRPQDLGIPLEKFLPYEPYEERVPPMPAWGDGYRVNVVGLVHHPDGNVTKYSPEMHMACVSRIYRKIEDHADEIAQVEGFYLEGCRNLVVAYGTTTRSALEAVQELRAKGKNVGFLRLKTLWPFPESKIRSMVGQLQNVFFPEMNLGYMLHPLREALRDRARQFIPIPCLGELPSPDQIIEKIEEVIGK
ncbi:MAG: 2-oxoacid:acceptor oxidoreductase subunit alpha [Deltaproteobacteria bacterium]|nr:2-oxoacid:acceptor oxidoreductase subunit alpha [Deltaproteobacteria bacterium]